MKWTSDRIDELCALWGNGVPVQAIAGQFGISEKTARNYVYQYNAHRIVSKAKFDKPSYQKWYYRARKLASSQGVSVNGDAGR